MTYQPLQNKGLDKVKISTLLNMAYLHVDCADSFITDLKAELQRSGSYRLNVKHDVNKIKSMIDDFIREISVAFSTGEQEGFGDIADFLKYITTKILLAVRTEEDVKWFSQQVDAMLNEHRDFESKLEKLKRQKIKLQALLDVAENELVEAGIRKPAIVEDVSRNA